jgi:ABC-type lipoprotein release transport system permease subunit
VKTTGASADPGARVEAVRRFNRFYTLASLLYETSPHDPGIVAAVALLMVATAGAAALLPAWRATRVQPVDALRSD